MIIAVMKQFNLSKRISLQWKLNPQPLRLLSVYSELDFDNLLIKANIFYITSFSRPYLQVCENHCIPLLVLGNFMKMLIVFCPACDYQNVLIPVLSPFLAFMLQVDKFCVQITKSAKKFV